MTAWYAVGMLNVAYWSYRGFDGAVGGFLIALVFAIAMIHATSEGIGK